MKYSCIKKSVPFLFLILPILLLSQYQDIDGLITIEAENLNIKDDWSIQNTKPGFTGDGYIVWNGADNFNSPGNSVISTKISILNPGTYRVQWRNGIASGSSTTDYNDSWLRFPDASSYYASKTNGSTIYPYGSGNTPNPNGAGAYNYFKVYTNNLEWNFNTSTSDNDPHDIYVNFNTVGIYTLEISPRSNGHAIDRIVLYQEQVANPLNLSNIETNTSGGGGETSSTTISGSLLQYHKLTLTFDAGKSYQETASTYQDNRLDVTFSAPSGKTFKVPGYFAADGNAYNSSATSGTKWRVNFLPTETGTYLYTTSFKTGSNIVVNPNNPESAAALFDGETGSFTIDPTNKTGKDFRAKGKIEYNGTRYAQFSNGDHYLEFGADSPETFLEYAYFDNTPNGKTYASHTVDFNQGEPTWKDGKGTELIGVINYLASEEMNIQYFITMNINGDGQNAFPFTTASNFTTYDVSKLSQWEIIFDYMTTKGIASELLLLETENLNWFEIQEGVPADSFSDSRKIYYREMIARFGHLNGIIYNIGEESNWSSGGNQYSAAQILEAAAYINNLAPYNDLITVHNGPSNDDTIFNNLLGDINLNSISFQGDFDNETHGHDAVLNWINKSNISDNQWLVRYTEPYSASANPNIETWTANALWAALTAGSAGIQYYAGGGQDISATNYRDFEPYYKRMRFAHDFFRGNDIPFWDMTNQDNLVSNGHLLFKDQEYYVGFIKNGGNTTINLSGSNPYSVKWFDPRNGGNLINGTLTTINSGSNIDIGSPPNNTNKSWVFLITQVVIENREDDDNDGVLNIHDLCPNTLLGEVIDENGCSISVFPADQFKITSTGTSCINTNNGSILIESKTTDDFSATLIGPEKEVSIEFSELLKIAELKKGTYTLCITSTNYPNYKNFSKIIISEPEPLSVQLELNSLTNSVTLKVSGNKGYTVSINGKSTHTNSNEINLPLYDEVNTVSVISDQVCLGNFEETIILKNAFLIYPNPIENDLNIDTKSLTSEFVEISIFSETGVLLRLENFKVEQSPITLDMSSLSSGIYFLRLKDDKINKPFKIIKS